MSAKKYFLTIQYRLHRINASDIVRMIESGGITIDDVPDQLKKKWRICSMQRVTVIKLNNDDIKMILSKHFDVPLEKVKSTGYSYEIIADEEKGTVKDGNDN